MSIVADAIQSNTAAQQQENQATAESLRQATIAIARSTRTGKSTQDDGHMIAALIADGSLSSLRAREIEHDCRRLWEAVEKLKDEKKIAEANILAHQTHKALQERNRTEWKEACDRLRLARNDSSSINAAKTTVGEMRIKLSELFAEGGTLNDPAKTAK